MEYVVITTKGNNVEVLSRHSDYDSALAAGKSSYEKLNRTVSIISGNINDKGEITGKYKLYKSWF